MRVVLTIALAAAVAACTSSKAVSRDQFGDQWPLTVDAGSLRCEQLKVIFRAPDGTDDGVYDLPTGGYPVGSGYADIRAIWADDPSGIAPKKDLGPLIQAGKELCNL